MEKKDTQFSEVFETTLFTRGYSTQSAHTVASYQHQPQPHPNPSHSRKESLIYLVSGLSYCALLEHHYVLNVLHQILQFMLKKFL